MSKCSRKVVVDEFRRQVAGLPGKALAQDRELLPVAGAGSDPVGVSAGKFKNFHGEKPYQRRDRFLGGMTILRNSQNRYNRPHAPLAQLSRDPSGRARGIVRITWTALFGLFVFLNWAGLSLVALLLGQLGEIAADRTRTRDGRRPTDGAFH